MLCSKAQNKKKKTASARNIKISSSNRTQKSIAKFANSTSLIKSQYFTFKPTQTSNTPLYANIYNQNMRWTKSQNVTPSTKSRVSSKQNAFNSSQFCPKNTFSKKKSQTIDLLDYNNNSILLTSIAPTKGTNSRSKNDYRFIYQIGSGGFGRVWKVQDKKQGNKVFAMKQMSKAKIIAKKSIASIINQKQLLAELNNNFIINSYKSFQDRENLYLVMQYLRGGDLRYHMCFYEFFNQQQTKFITACIVLALQYLHCKGIIHRDLKPQNIVFEQNGYARLTDLGVARKKKTKNSEQTSGTPGYMSPQVICRMNHSFQSDFFALGVIVYQLILGIRPYMGQSRKQIRQKILAHQAKIHPQDIPPGWSTDSVDFINKLLKRNSQHRLGYNGIQQVKEHPWMRSINWSKLSKKQLIPPFCPGVVCQSRQYQKQMQTSMVSQVNQQAQMLLRTEQIQKLFKEYDKLSSSNENSKNTKGKSKKKQHNKSNKKLKNKITICHQKTSKDTNHNNKSGLNSRKGSQKIL